ncbi:MAG: hypothetical protein AB1589_17835 [Cyanobacteriota bacterium]
MLTFSQCHTLVQKLHKRQGLFDTLSSRVTRAAEIVRTTDTPDVLGGTQPKDCDHTYRALPLEYQGGSWQCVNVFF